jgi:hypothetical protein
MDQIGQKFWTEWRNAVVDSSTGAPDAGAVVMLGPDGKIDPSMLPASGSDIVITTLTANQTIGAYQVVAVHSDGMAYLASSASVADASQTIGIAISSAVNPGDTLQVQQVGFLTNLGWNWQTPGVTLFLGVAGVLTTNPSTGVFEIPMGTVISNTEIEVQLGLPIIFA